MAKVEKMCIKMLITLCIKKVKLCVKNIKNNYSCAKNSLFTKFSIILHHFLPSLTLPVINQSFPLFHIPYYNYYDYYLIERINK